MPDIFTVNCDKDNTITIVCGDSFSRNYNIEDAVEVVFHSPAFRYQIPLTKSGLEWNLSISPQQTQIIEEGSYRYQIKARYTNGTVKTFEEDIIKFMPSVFPIYKTYPVVIKPDNPTPQDNIYGVPTVWYNKNNETLWVLESNINGVAEWRKTSNLSYIYQTAVTEHLKFSGDTSGFSLLQITDGQNITVIPGVYNIIDSTTEYHIPNFSNIIKADYYLYADKSLEERQQLGTFEQEVDPSLIIYKYTYIKDSLEDVKVLDLKVENYRNSLSEEQLNIIRTMVNQMITDAKFPTGQ